MINNFWLSAISNRVSLSPLIFVVGISGTTILAILTIASQTIRSAHVDIVENLRID